MPGEQGIGTLALWDISVSAAAENHVFVIGGLASGDIVVTGGVPFLRDGQTVRLLDDVLKKPNEASR